MLIDPACSDAPNPPRDLFRGLTPKVRRGGALSAVHDHINDIARPTDGTLMINVSESLTTHLLDLATPETLPAQSCGEVTEKHFDDIYAGVIGTSHTRASVGVRAHVFLAVFIWICDLACDG